MIRRFKNYRNVFQKAIRAAKAIYYKNLFQNDKMNYHYGIM